jgi:2-aminoadipate transaminase
MDERIDRLQRACAAAADVLPLAGGLPHEALFPRARLAEAFLRLLSRPRCSALQYGWPEGDCGLRAWIASRLRRRGAAVHEQDVVITCGAQQAIAIAVEHLTARGDRAGVDVETYPAVLDLLRDRAVLPVPDSNEVDWSYAMVGVDNPRGAGMPPARRDALLASGRPIIVDEAYAELRFDGRLERPLLADARDRVWHVGTFSKVLCPGLRVGWLVPPPAARDAVVRSKRHGDLEVGTLAQAIVTAFLLNDDFDARLARTRVFYEARAHRLVAALRRWVPSWTFTEPEGGFSVFVQTDLDGDAARFLECAVRHGVSFDPGCLFRAVPAPEGARLAMRLCFSSTPSIDDIDTAVLRLVGAAREHAGRQLRQANPAQLARP